MPTARKPKRKSIDVSPQAWEQIRSEYITTDTSYRILAEKYGISYARLQGVAHDNGWQKDKDAFKNKLLDKSLDIICDEQAHRIARAVAIGDKMLEKVEESLEQIDMVLCRTTMTKRTYKKDEEGNTSDITETSEDFDLKKVAIDRAGLRQLSAVLKDLREIGIFRSELDKREQEARIKKLQKESEEENKDTTINVVFEGDMDEYAN